MNSGLRRLAVTSVKRGNIFVVRTLGKVHSAGRVSTSDNFSPYNRAVICINVSNFFYVF